MHLVIAESIPNIVNIIIVIITDPATMLAVSASHSSSFDMWRAPKGEEAKDRPTVGSWRERRVSQESGEVKGVSGNWRVKVQKEAPKVDWPKVYGGSIPPESRLKVLYKHFKIDNDKFTTWLVESVYPSVESLPSYITLPKKQDKGEREADPSGIDIEPSPYHRQ